MKYALTTFLLLITINAHAQFSHKAVQAYTNEVVESVQGYIDNTGESEEDYPYTTIKVNESMNFSSVRTMVGLITKSYSDVNVFQSWKKNNEWYEYWVVVGNTPVVLGYNPKINVIMIIKHPKNTK